MSRQEENIPPAYYNGKMSSNDDKPQSTYQRPAGLMNLFGQVDEVKTTMQQNVQLINERQQKLEELENTSVEMMGQAQNLAESGAKKKKK